MNPSEPAMTEAKYHTTMWNLQHPHLWLYSVIEREKAYPGERFKPLTDAGATVRIGDKTYRGEVATQTRS